MLVKEAVSITGGLSKPSKMPGYSYNIPAMECNVGSALNKIKGSVCYKCYARKGRYLFKNVLDAMYRRLSSLDGPKWEEAMIFLIERYRVTKGYDHFRWHDSGDLRDAAHLDKIISVCKGTPLVRHWLPTKEIHIIKRFSGEVPENLCIRQSAFYIDKMPKKPVAGFPFSTVNSNKVNSTDVWGCPSFRTFDDGEMLSEEAYHALPPKHGLDLGHCGECRACWTKSTDWVSYALH